MFLREACISALMSLSTIEYGIMSAAINFPIEREILNAWGELIDILTFTHFEVASVNVELTFFELLYSNRCTGVIAMPHEFFNIKLKGFSTCHCY